MRSTTTEAATAQIYGGLSESTEFIARSPFTLTSHLSMSELPLPGDDHGNTVTLGRLNDLRIPHRAAGLNDGGHSSGGRLLHPIGKGKEGVRREHAACRVVSLLLGLVHGQKAAVHPAHLAGSDSDGHLVPG